MHGQHGLPRQDQGAPPPQAGRIVIEPAGHAFEPRPPYGADVPGADTECDGWSASGLTLRWATVRGDWHRYYNKPRQDQARAAVHRPTGAVAFAVADGVSSAELADAGALEACTAAVRDILGQLDRGARQLDLRQVVASAARGLRAMAAHHLRLADPPEEQVSTLYATTLVAGVILPHPGPGDPATSAAPAAPRGPLAPTTSPTPAAPAALTGPVAALVRVGDSCAWTLDRGTGEYRALFRPKGGEVVLSNSVAALPRVPAQPEQVTVQLGPGLLLLAGTDGFGDPLGDGTGQVGLHFASQLIPAPPSPLAFAGLLDFSRENIDDDRTLLAIWTRRE